MKTSKAIEHLQKLGYVFEGKKVSKPEKLETFEIEGYTVTKPKVCKTFAETKTLCPKGFYLPTRWKLFKIFEKMENRKKLSDGGFMFFWSSLIENNYSKGLCLYSVLNLDSYGGNLAISIGNGRVVFEKCPPAS